jgi:hypothetical protein
MTTRLTVKEAAAHVRSGKSCVYDWLAMSWPVKRTVGNRYVIKLSEINALGDALAEKPRAVG